MTDRENVKPANETSFEEAQAYFKDCLSNNGVSSDLLWVFREDVIFLYDRIFIRTQFPIENEIRAKACMNWVRREISVSICTVSACWILSYAVISHCLKMILNHSIC